jgi:hypothetical protein
MPNYVQGTLLNPLSGLVRGAIGHSFGVNIASTITASPGGLVRAAGGIVTVTVSAAHNWQIGNTVFIGLGQVAGTGGIPGATGAEPTSVGGTRFNGRYTIMALPTGTSATLVPTDPVILHQAPDTGGTGTAISVAYETPTAPQAGQAFALAGPLSLSSSFGFAVDGKFSGAPGAFEVDVQCAEIDADANYQTLSGFNITTVDATNNTFHADCTLNTAKFARARLLSRTNSVGLVVVIRG